jgi:hypothetical protein
MPLDLSIIIVTHNVKELLNDCLKSIYTNVHWITYEVLVVDNNSQDDTVKLIKTEFPQVHLIANDANLGFAKANNQAIYESKGRYILLLNPDTIVLPEALNKMVSFMDTHKDAGAVGPKLLNPDYTTQASCGRFPTLPLAISHFFFIEKIFPNWNLLGKYIKWHYDKISEVDHLLGACLMVRREVIDKVGMLDEGYFIYTEETDWCFRIKKYGFKIYFFPEAKIIHLGGKCGNKHIRKKALFEGHQGLYRFYKKHYGKKRLFVLKCLTIIGFLLRLVICGIIYPFIKDKAMIKTKCEFYFKTILSSIKQLPLECKALPR